MNTGCTQSQEVEGKSLADSCAEDPEHVQFRQWGEKSLYYCVLKGKNKPLIIFRKAQPFF
jgi:hypothetical protein